MPTNRQRSSTGGRSGARRANRGVRKGAQENPTTTSQRSGVVRAGPTRGYQSAPAGPASTLVRPAAPASRHRTSRRRGGTTTPAARSIACRTVVLPVTVLEQGRGVAPQVAPACPSGRRREVKTAVTPGYSLSPFSPRGLLNPRPIYPQPRTLSTEVSPRSVQTQAGKGFAPTIKLTAETVAARI